MRAGLILDPGQREVMRRSSLIFPYPGSL